ncbi:MAG: hypothetical protein ACTS3F_01855 [Phycisphaerales bacterium]
MDANCSRVKPTVHYWFSHRVKSVGGGITLGLIGITAASVLGFWACGRIDLLLLLPFHHVFSTGFIITVPNFVLCVVAMCVLNDGPGGRQRGWGWMWLGIAMSALMMGGIFSIYSMGLLVPSSVGHPAVEFVKLLALFSFGCFSGVPSLLLAIVGAMHAKEVEATRLSYPIGDPAREAQA